MRLSKVGAISCGNGLRCLSKKPTNLTAVVKKVSIGPNTSDIGRCYIRPIRTYIFQCGGIQGHYTIIIIISKASWA